MTGTHDPNMSREQLLRDSSDGECLSLAHVDYVAGLIAAESLAARQKLLMDTVRSLIDDGLMVIGNIDGGSDERVEPWDLSLDDAMAPEFATSTSSITKTGIGYGAPGSHSLIAANGGRGTRSWDFGGLTLT